jgi:hypothetical protein
MMNYKTFILFLVSGLLFSCSESKKEEQQIEEFNRPIFNETPVDDAYSSLRPAIQKFEINNDKPTTIVADGGTEILIPQGCFVDNEGNSVKGKVQIEVIEAFTLSDFITSGLATLSDEKLLLSNGMLFIDAKSSGNSLKIKNNSELTVEMPTMASNNGFQMFTGDGQNWSVDSSMLEDDYIIPLPLSLLYPRGYEWLYHCSRGIDDKIAYYDTTIISYTQPKYENTIIATREFNNRHGALMHMMSNMSLFTQEDYYFDKVDCFGRKFNYDIFKIYYNNPSQSLCYLDSIAKTTYEKYFLENKDKISSFCNKVNEHKREYFSNWTDTNYHFDFRERSLEEWFLYPLNNFPERESRELKIVNDYGVNLNSADAYEQLVALNIPTNKINEILEYNFKRQSLIKQLEREKKAIEDKETLSKMYETTVFSTKQLGWINCDMFYEDPNAGKAEIMLANKSEEKLNFIDFSLVIPEMNVRLMSFPRENNLYSFTKEKGPYTKLPLGRDAIIIGVSIQNDSVFFASKKVKIEDGLKLDFKMNHIQTASLKDSLEIALKKPI